MNSFLFRFGALNAGTSVIISAVGGHKQWEESRKSVFTTAYNLHMTSSIGMMISSTRFSSFGVISGLLLFAGASLFSGTAYYRCFTDDKKHNYLMPYGGMGIISGWLLLALS